MKRPILVIQMQRMGDLLLTFPLLLWLARQHPGHPLWVVAEPQFFEPLRVLGPAVRYIAPEDAAFLRQERFFRVINLSHRSPSAQLAGELRTEDLCGMYTRQGVRRVAGLWQEYRASLVHNNRHNRFHWAEMNALGVVPLDVIRHTRWPFPRTQSASSRVGFFVGASQEAKRPTAAFWAKTVHLFEAQGYFPVLLGGPAEKELCQEILRRTGHSVPCACGKMRLDHLARFGEQLTALVTPDTGPMHLAAWTGLRTLCLSMGPVHAWETGPYQPGHVVVRSRRACVGCWECRFLRPRCPLDFSPAAVTRIFSAFFTQSESGSEALPAHLEVLRTGRTELGLYTLNFLSEAVPFCARTMLGMYWRAFWLFCLASCQEETCLGASRVLFQNAPRLVEHMRLTALRLLRVVLKGTECPELLDVSRAAAHSRFLQTFCINHLRNHDCSTASLARVRFWLSTHLSFLESSKN